MRTAADYQPYTSTPVRYILMSTIYMAKCANGKFQKIQYKYRKSDLRY
jgi:hypothetical protein